MRKNKKEQILQAAYELFLENGYDNTSMSAIAARAKVSSAHAYIFYDTKESLLDAAIRKSIDTCFLAMSSAVKAGHTGSTEEYILICMETLDSIRKEALFVIHSVLTPKLSERVVKIIREYDGSLSDVYLPFLQNRFNDKDALALDYALAAIFHMYFMYGNAESCRAAALSLLQKR